MAKLIIVGVLTLAVLTLGYQAIFKEDISQNFGGDFPKEEEVEEDRPFGQYSPPTIKPAESYTIFLLGDSMTNALGPHGGKFAEILSSLYVGKGILVDNYGVGSTNILSIEERLDSPTTVWDVTFDPIAKRHFDLIIIESFGYNPLSQFGLGEGLKKQNEQLDKLMKTLTKEFPQSQIIFLATISPNKTIYARKVSGIPPEQSKQQAEERIAYIKNHIEFAKAHDIALINVYEKSLGADGDGNLIYINPDDDIHPSHAGIELISNTMANFIFDKGILPK